MCNAIQDWNKVPENIKNKTLYGFKKEIKSLFDSFQTKKENSEWVLFFPPTFVVSCGLNEVCSICLNALFDVYTRVVPIYRRQRL